MAIQSLVKPVISRTRYRLRLMTDARYIFKSIISHPMETGKRKNPRSGKLVPADYIDKLTVSLDDEVIYEARMTINTSKNPFISFIINKPLFNGQKLVIDVLDNKGKKMAIINTLAFDNNGKYEFIDKHYRVDDVVYPICRDKANAANGGQR